MSEETTNQAQDENELIRQRRDKLSQWRLNAQAYPNTFRPENLASDLMAKYEQLDKEELETQGIKAIVSGRLMTRRIMGKASFAHIQDRTGRLQIYAVSYTHLTLPTIA